jgi:DNA-binding XRE family transcriptional regulator
LAHPRGRFRYLQYITTFIYFLQLINYNNAVRCETMEVNVEKLLELRINKGLSQNRLAQLSGVSQTAIWKIEHGGGANPATLKKIADVLGVRPVDLLRERR